MYVEPIYTYGEGNIVSYNECIAYYYSVKPINSLYASDNQLSTLVDNLFDKILSINMPGEIVIQPFRINEKGILQYYEHLYKIHGRPELDNIKKKYMKDMKNQISEKIKYKYRIFVIFTDNRDPIKKKRSLNLLKKDNSSLTKRMVELSEVVDEQLYKKLSSNLSCERLNKKEIEQFHNYLAMPVEGTIADYYTNPQATELLYDYKYIKQTVFKQLYTRILIADELKVAKASGNKVNTAVNEIQLYGYPVDTIIKFDLEHTQQFKRNMSAKREDIRKRGKVYTNLSDRKDKDAEKAVELAKIGENVDASIEDSKIRWQMMFRIRANTSDMLSKRSDNLMKKMEGKGVSVTYAIGEQEKLANHIFPFKSDFHYFYNLTDVRYFARFNFWGGLYIGEESDGVVLTNTKPADLPILVDIEAPIKGKTKNASSTMIVAGETGSGKSQVANNTVVTSMIFYGHRCLVVDPKGDRYNLVNLLKSYGDITSHLIIGSADCPSGMFDAFLLHQNDQVEALAVAKNDIVSLSRAVNHDQSIDLLKIDEAYEKMCLAKSAGKIKRLTMRYLIDYLMEFDPGVASNVKSLQKDPMARLFYADETTDISEVFRMDKAFNLVTFAKMPVYSSDEKMKVSYDDDKLDHIVFALILSKVMDITNMFLRNNKGIAKSILFDECKLFASIPGGMSILINNNLIARSELCNLYILLQNWSDLPDSIINNTGQFFIGNMKSKKEIGLILNHFDLDENSTIANILQDTTKNEGVNEDKQYNFLYCDYNNRKCVTKLKFLPLFSTAFKTFKNDDIPKYKKAEITNGDNIYDK